MICCKPKHGTYIQRLLRDAMTAKELRDELEMLDDNTLVLFAHCQENSDTLQALPISQIDEFDDDNETLEESSYSRSRVALVKNCPESVAIDPNDVVDVDVVILS